MTLSQQGVEAPIAYLAGTAHRAEHRIYPIASGQRIVRPEHAYHTMPIVDCRNLSPAPTLASHGFELVRRAATAIDFYANDGVQRYYYPEVIALLTAHLGAEQVFVFDHNQRSAVRAGAGQSGVRTPVEAAHVDYTPTSGPKRAREILRDAGHAELADRHLALINVWRPIAAPAEDMPIAVCAPFSTAAEDFIATDIHHFGEDDLEHPRHSGEIYSLRYSAAHRWFFAPSMRPDEALLLLNWDSADTAHRCYAAHTGFRNPAAPPGAQPRESIEVRTLVVYP